MRLVLAIGGGGDIVSAAVLAVKLGAEAGLLPWERYVVDPEPGPLLRKDFLGAEGDNPLFLIGPDARAVRRGRTITPQGACVSSVLGQRVYAISPDAPPSLVAEALASRFDKITGVDVGGDVLACGCEPELHSPLADSYSLAVLKRAEDLGVDVEVAVVGLGADGELSRDYLVNRVSTVLANGGFLGYYALDPSDSGILAELTSKCVTEASRNILRALRGEFGEVAIRGGSRSAYIDVFTPVFLRFKPSAVIAINEIAALIYKHDWNILKAALELRKMGYTTEYDFEKYVAEGLPPSEALARAKAERSCTCNSSGARYESR
ncbi:MAG: DUF1152 domain-containing protein [Thermoproteus sp.]|jgi:hypothetical protein